MARMSWSLKEVGSLLDVAARRRHPFWRQQHFRTSGAFVSRSAASDVSGGSTAPFYLYIEDVENLECYEPGGYHPVHIGDVFESRYRVIHKLGHGAYSTVWLARDDRAGKMVALKVGMGGQTLRDVSTLNTLAQRLSSETKNLVQAILDTFRVQGPNGIHHCSVTALARCSLLDTREASCIRIYSLEVARAFAAQLALGVAGLHAAGCVHGDLHMGNLFLKMPAGFDRLSQDEIYERCGAPRCERIAVVRGVRPSTGLPSYAVPRMWLSEPCEDVTLRSARLLLADFGEAFFPRSETITRSNTPVTIRPPEAHFEPTRPLSFSSDIWSLACTIWQLVGQRSLFNDFLPTQDSVISEQVGALGTLPADWWERWGAKREYFTEDGQPAPGKEPWAWGTSFENCIQKPRRAAGGPALGGEEARALSGMLKGMLRYRPEERCTAEEVLRSEWMVEWALPEVERLSKMQETRVTGG